jgi:hypothetical protein
MKATAWFVAATFALAAGGSAPAGARRIDSRLEMFVDGYLIERLEGGANLKLHAPRFQGVAVSFDNPWEGPCTGFATVIKDGGLYRMYYVGIPFRVYSDNKDTTFCCAESRDGINWVKPKLGLVDYNGSKENNILLAWDPKEGYVHNLSPFLDTRPGVAPAERFKAVGSGSNGWPERTLYTLVSPDGIHWKKKGVSKKFPLGRFDTQNVAFWWEPERCYVLYCREYATTDPVWDLARRLAEDRPGSKVEVPNRGLDYNWRYNQGFRTIVKATSKDALSWENQQRMSFGNTPMEELYTFHATPYFRAPHVIIGAPMRYVPGRSAMTRKEFQGIELTPMYAGASSQKEFAGDSPIRNSVSDTVLITSRGGYRFDRTFMEAFIRPGPDLKNWASRNGMTATGYVQTGPTEMSIYVQEHYAQASARIARYAMRLDGFASVNAPYKGGEMVTRPLLFQGSQLVLNFSTSAAGGISVELQEERGEPIPGFTLEESEVMVGDRIERAVAWRDGDLRRFSGRPIKLRFVMKDADLYSIRFR